MTRSYPVECSLEQYSATSTVRPSIVLLRIISPSEKSQIDSPRVACSITQLSCHGRGIPEVTHKRAWLKSEDGGKGENGEKAERQLDIASLAY